MRTFFGTLLRVILIIAALGTKIYFDYIEKPEFSLNQIGKAVAAHNITQFDAKVDVKGLAQSVTDDFFANINLDLTPAVLKALKQELTIGISQQIRDYVSTGRLNPVCGMQLSRPAQEILKALSLKEEDLKQFRKVTFVKEKENTALAGIDLLQLGLKKEASGWKVTRVVNFMETKVKLHQREQQKNIKSENLLVQGMKDSVVWGLFNRENVYLDLENPKESTWPTSLLIGADNATGLHFTLINEDKKIPLNFSPGQAEAFAKDGKLNKGYYIQAGEYDLTGDGTPEIIIAIGDNNIDLVVNVFQFDPHDEMHDASLAKNWKRAGVFMGQDKAFLEGRKIKLPYPAVNIYKEYQATGTGFKELY